MSEIHELLTKLNDRIAKYRGLPAGINDLGLALAAGRIVDDTEALLKALQIRAYEPSESTDDRVEQVVITVHGVDLSIRGRTGDLFVHVDSSERDHADAVKYPLVVEVNNAGENDYPTDEAYVACQGRTCTFNAHVDDLDAWEKHNAECPEVDDEGDRI